MKRSNAKNCYRIIADKYIFLKIFYVNADHKISPYAFINKQHQKVAKYDFLKRNKSSYKILQIFIYINKNVFTSMKHGKSNCHSSPAA